MAKTKPAKVPDGWRPVAGFMLFRTVGNRRLQVGVTQDVNGKWMMLALEGPVGGSAQSVLDDHAHKIIGARADLAQAIFAAELYAKRWTPGSSPDCTCEDIASPARSRRRAASRPSRRARA